MAVIFHAALLIFLFKWEIMQKKVKVLLNKKKMYRRSAEYLKTKDGGKYNTTE
jgi:hypothetical protein